MSDITEEEWEEVLAKNKYLSKKNVYDCSEIMLEGKIPELPTAADKFRCAMEFGEFVERNGFCKQEENVARFLGSISSEYRVIFLKIIGLEKNEHCMRHKAFKQVMIDTMKATV